MFKRKDKYKINLDYAGRLFILNVGKSKKGINWKVKKK